MKRLLLLPAAFVLIAAAPVPVSVTPPEIALGVPLTVTMELPDKETELAGLPPLEPFELLAPPRKDGNQLRIVLLPMRAGRCTIPSLPLRQGLSGQLATAPLEISVSEGIPKDAKPAPLKRLSRTDKVRTVLPALLLLSLMVPLGLYLRHRRREKKTIVPSVPEASEKDAFLTALSRELEILPLPDERREALRRRLERLRFAPGERSEEEFLEFQTDLRRGEQEP